MPRHYSGYDARYGRGGGGGGGGDSTLTRILPLLLENGPNNNSTAANNTVSSTLKAMVPATTQADLLDQWNKYKPVAADKADKDSAYNQARRTSNLISALAGDGGLGGGGTSTAIVLAIALSGNGF
jgi:hypothetical protein